MPEMLLDYKPLWREWGGALEGWKDLDLGWQQASSLVLLLAMMMMIRRGERSENLSASEDFDRQRTQNQDVGYEAMKSMNIVTCYGWVV
jgi:hypothetical protein